MESEVRVGEGGEAWSAKQGSKRARAQDDRGQQGSGNRETHRGCKRQEETSTQLNLDAGEM